MSTPPPPPPPPPGYGGQPPYGPGGGYGQPYPGQPYPTYPAQPYPGQSPYGGVGYGYQAPRDHPKATTAMVLGIVSLVVGFLCGFGFLLGPVALVVGRKAVKEIDASGGALGGRAQATAGWICGLVSTIFVVLGVLGIVLLVVLSASSSSALGATVVP